MRDVIEEAVKMAINDGDKLTNYKEVARRFAEQYADKVIKPVFLDGIELTTNICGVDEQPLLTVDTNSISGTQVRDAIAEAIHKAILDFYHWHVSNEVQDYMKAIS